MLFSSIPFLYYYLPCVMFFYFLTPGRFKNTVLLFASLVFYAWGEPRLVILMLSTITVGYALGVLTEKYPKYKKVFTGMSVGACLFSLGFFKYADFFVVNINQLTGFSIPLLRIALPIGISFYTFQILSYNVDVYRGAVKAQRNYIDLALYISMFPQLVAGPIVRYSHIEKQLKKRNYSFDRIAAGIRRFVLGLSKKILIANAMGELCQVFRASNDKSILFFWVYAIAFTLHIYFDFSGYSDMAIGIGKILGFDFMENFNYPYISKSITEFWRRWHMSLGQWFRDYVYIPLGGSRVKKWRMFVNIFVVWMLTGFWHGAAWNFIIWGLYFAILLIVEKVFLYEKLIKLKFINRVYVLVSVIVSFVIFNATSINEALNDIGGMLGIGDVPLYSQEAIYNVKNYGVIFAIAIIGATPIPKKIVEKVKVLQYAEAIVLLLLMTIITAYLVDGSFNPFLYFRF